MSAPGRAARRTLPALRARKDSDGRVETPIVCLTAYDAPTAAALDPHCDLLLVGDSLGMVVYGFDTTLPVTLDIMIAHGAAVVRGARDACVAVDMPFGSYEASPEAAFDAAARVMRETGAAGVKLEGGEEMAATIAFLVSRGVPVIGHVGLRPQSVHAIGGFRAQARDVEGEQMLVRDARAVADAGASLVVVEAVMADAAAAATAACPAPTIGIGASAACDGQILVTEDMVGLTPGPSPRFVRRYAELGAALGEAAARYADDVRNRRFPDDSETYRPKPKP
ncbi:MAG: 3-methyl-2-oxobutanoate hydroxymethyltransferase [Pseudomonadota bacterium]